MVKEIAEYDWQCPDCKSCMTWVFFIYLLIIRKTVWFDFLITTFCEVIFFYWKNWSYKMKTVFKILTLNDLWWPRGYFFWNVDVKSVILIYNLPYSIKLKNLTYFWDFWPGWDPVTSRALFSKRWRQERHFDIQFTHFQRTSKFDPTWPQIWNLT